jgi:hypothetical protein
MHSLLKPIQLAIPATGHRESDILLALSLPGATGVRYLEERT